MLIVTDVAKSYGPQELFSGASFQINPRERVGMVGRNGHGKTTLLRLITGREEPDEGKIEFSKGYRVGYLEQHLTFAQPTILDEAALGLMPGAEHESWRAEKILRGLGFGSRDLTRAASEFSGGYQSRIHLARVLVSEPDLLILDEPTNYLDITALRWLQRFLATWPRELLLVTHNRNFMDGVVTHVVGIHRQKVRKFPGDTQQYYNLILQEEEVFESTRQKEERKRAHAERFITRFRAKARLAGMVQSRVKMLEKQDRKEKLTALESLEFSFTSLSFAAKVMLGVDDLTFGYHLEKKPLIDGLTFHIGRGDRIGVVGPNGRGKTTLLRLLAGELQPWSGSIRPHPTLTTAYYGQTNIDRLQAQRNVVEEILTASPDVTPQRARDLAGAMLFSGDHALKPISVLSGGERARVLLGKLLATPAHMLLLDEPTNHLDLESCDSLLGAIDSFDGAVVMVTHNEMLLEALATRLIVFDRGAITSYEGPYREFLERVGWEEDSDDSHACIIAPDDDDPPVRRMSRKERAKFVQDRARALRPLQQKVDDLEAAVAAAEQELNEVNAALVDASGSGDGEQIAELGRRAHELTPQIESSYAALDAATTALEAETANWPEPL
ncbi:MAG TPA: ABC-F family ATP-binding cassette domain-containing protein [bacterium]|nr:ABC-F family ATP-binding cassette domain-containing protein [bacterium]